MNSLIRGKIWGNTSTLFDKNNVEIARIEVNIGGYCSKHKHSMKYNMFFVESGKLKIVIYRPAAGKTIEDITILSGGNMTYVEPGLYHSFEALAPTVAYEIYWTEMSSNDIERESVGGMREL